MTLHRLCAPHFLRAVCLVALLSGLFGCGRSGWPQPQMSEDLFRWRSVAVHRMGGCVVTECELAGAWRNVESVRVMLEPIGTGPGDGCAACPFVPRITRIYSLGAPEVRRDMNRLVITTCGLDPAKTYRVKVLLNNVYRTLQPVVSETLLAAPK